MSAHSGDDKYDEIQKRLHKAKHDVLHPQSPEERDAAQRVVEQIEDEARSYSNDLNERMRQHHMKTMTNRLLQ